MQGRVTRLRRPPMIRRMLGRLLTFACLLGTLAAPAPLRAQTAEAGLPDDSPQYTVQSAGKFLHFLAGMSLGLLGAGLAESALQPGAPQQQPLALPAIAVSVSVPFGIAKEVLDSTGFGDPRFADILITTSGGLAAAVVVGYTELLYPPSASGKRNGYVFLVSTSALLAVPVVFGFLREIRTNIDRRRTR